MRKGMVGVFSAVFVGLMATSGFALSLNDAGVVGTIEAGTQSSNVANEIAWAQHLLNMGASATQTVNAGGPPATENYATSNVDYNGTLNNGTQVGVSTNILAFEYVLAKYDGQNAGYVLFHSVTWAGSFGNTTRSARARSISSCCRRVEPLAWSSRRMARSQSRARSTSNITDCIASR